MKGLWIKGSRKFIGTCPGNRSYSRVGLRIRRRCGREEVWSMRERLEELLDVKSLMTLALTGGFISLTCAGRITGDQFLTIFTMITGFYFGAQAHRSMTKEKEK